MFQFLSGVPREKFGHGGISVNEATAARINGDD
jgi:hypothetical protein